MNNDDHNNKYQDSTEKWEAAEEYIKIYELGFASDATNEDKRKSQDAAENIINLFEPLVQKYLNIIKDNNIDFNDYDAKAFVSTFISDSRLTGVLKKKFIDTDHRAAIYYRFNFIVKVYGQIPREEIRRDLQILLLVLAKRYKPVGKNFCAYVRNCYKFEVSRFIKNFIKNPLNKTYNLLKYEDELNGECEDGYTKVHKDEYYESDDGIPNSFWINGFTCEERFLELTSLERKILVKYYAEEYNDKQIAEQLGIKNSTVNQRRRQAVAKLAKQQGIDVNDLKRNRHSGKRKK